MFTVDRVSRQFPTLPTGTHEASLQPIVRQDEGPLGNPARMFFEEHLRADAPEMPEREKHFVPTSYVYNEYRKWCDRWGYSGKLCRENFCRELRHTFPKAVRKRKRADGSDSRCWGYCGISYMSNGELPPSLEEAPAPAQVAMKNLAYDSIASGMSIEEATQNARDAFARGDCNHPEDAGEKAQQAEDAAERAAHSAESAEKAAAHVDEALERSGRHVSEKQKKERKIEATKPAEAHADGHFSDDDLDTLLEILVSE